jgi:hypothetical protein
VIKVEFNSFVTLSAFRYALGKKGYVVSEVAEYIINNWNNLEIGHQFLIVREIKEAIKNNKTDDDCDIECWKNVLRKIK